jgi:hypothetical protein
VPLVFQVNATLLLLFGTFEALFDLSPTANGTITLQLLLQPLSLPVRSAE